MGASPKNPGHRDGAARELASRLAAVADAGAVAISHRPLVWAAVRFGQSRYELGYDRSAVLREVEALCSGSYDGSTTNGGSEPNQELTSLHALARQAAMLGFHTDLLNGTGARDSVLTALLRRDHAAATSEEIPILGGTAR